MLIFNCWLCACMLSRSVMSNSLWPFAAHQAPLSMEFSRQENWSGLPIPPPGDSPNSEIKPASLCLLQWQDDSLPLSHLKNCIIDHTSLCHWFLGSCVTNSPHSINFVECNYIYEIHNIWKKFPIDSNISNKYIIGIDISLLKLLDNVINVI